jgi:hypothetical protein
MHCPDSSASGGAALRSHGGASHGNPIPGSVRDEAADSAGMTSNQVPDGFLAAGGAVWICLENRTGFCL